MNDSGLENSRSGVAGGDKKVMSVSVRKIAANRHNALKSTGPRTSRGKSYSRRNALKHGLFAMDLFPDFLATREKPEEFQELLDRLQKYYKPLGAAEELEVERIAVCWWRLKRALRFENAEMLCGLIDVTFLASRKLMTPECRRLYEQLKSAEKEIEATGNISQELGEKIFPKTERRRNRWAQVDENVKKNYEELLARQEGISLSAAREFLQNMARTCSKHETLEELSRIYCGTRL